jgi:hypothetical protein
MRIPFEYASPPWAPQKRYKTLKKNHQLLNPQFREMFFLPSLYTVCAPLVMNVTTQPFYYDWCFHARPVSISFEPEIDVGVGSQDRNRPLLHSTFVLFNRLCGGVGSLEGLYIRDTGNWNSLDHWHALARTMTFK